MHLRAVLGWALLFLLTLVPVITGVEAEPPADFALGAVSAPLGPWGECQVLLVDSLGQVNFYRSFVDSSGALDSLQATLDPAARRALYDSIMAAGFFALDSLYSNEADDGGDVRVTVIAGGADHSVEAINVATPRFDRIVRAINSTIQPYGMRLDYWSPTDSLPKSGGR
jgi:hypothetical protein